MQRSVGQTKPLRVNCGHSILRQTFLIVFIGVLACSCSSHPPPSFAITHVTLIDGTGAPAQPDMTVFLADEQIAAIGPSNSVFIPRETKTFDATGKFLIPGLVDMHAHLTGAGEPTGSREFILPLLLANGITTVRDMGGDLESLLKLRKEIVERKAASSANFLCWTVPRWESAVFSAFAGRHQFHGSRRRCSLLDFARRRFHQGAIEPQS